MLDINCLVTAVRVTFAATSYTVTEGVEGSVELTLVRTGGTSLFSNVTVTTTPGSASGKLASHTGTPLSQTPMGQTIVTEPL